MTLDFIFQHSKANLFLFCNQINRVEVEKTWPQKIPDLFCNMHKHEVKERKKIGFNFSDIFISLKMSIKASTNIKYKGINLETKIAINYTCKVSICIIIVCTSYFSLKADNT